MVLTGNTKHPTIVAAKCADMDRLAAARYRRETGNDISQDAFEARVVESAEFADQWGDWGCLRRAVVNWPKYVPAGEGLYHRADKGIDQVSLAG